MYEKMIEVLDSAYDLNVKTVTLDYDRVELEIPRHLVEDYKEINDNIARKRNMAVIGASEYHSELLGDEHLIHIKKKQPEFAIGEKVFFLLDAYKAPKDIESLKNIQDYCPDIDLDESMILGDIIMEFQY